MNTTLFDKVYKDYEKGWLMTLNDPLSKEEFLQKLKSDKSFAESYIKQKADENNLSFDEIVKIIENELKPKQ